MNEPTPSDTENAAAAVNPEPTTSTPNTDAAVESVQDASPVPAEPAPAPEDVTTFPEDDDPESNVGEEVKDDDGA